MGRRLFRAARLPFPAEPPRRSRSPAFAFAERAVAARPVVTVGVTVMPAGTLARPRAAASVSAFATPLPQPTVVWAGSRTAVTGHRRAGIHARFGSPLAVGDEFRDKRSLETRGHGDSSPAEQLEKPLSGLISRWHADPDPERRTRLLDVGRSSGSRAVMTLAGTNGPVHIDWGRAGGRSAAGRDEQRALVESMVRVPARRLSNVAPPTAAGAVRTRPGSGA